ncbi:hypothetical protein [Roseospira visakhapatnamensis]|uniref:Uncharacterized protein n=1 Tax=Roseospira visakhapatnamensis TaxID=390880 RepID=A0A7W6WBA1_9PROT|nr:hypothetical protein [Roseospira visakhapatnamensis]MBB4267799.1 hypothetical protein [Roseospira visakhapatnamensis]
MSEQQTHQGPTLMVMFSDGSIIGLPLHAPEPGHFMVSLGVSEASTIDVGLTEAGRWSHDMLTPARGVSVHLSF